MVHVYPLLTATPILDFETTPIAQLIDERGWRDLSDTDKIGAVYDFVRNEIAFGYNRADDIPASEVLSDGYGQCNTKGTLLMALLRGVGIKCRIHGFTIHKGLQRGVVPELVFPIAPPVEWTGQDTYIQETGIVKDFGTFDTPDAFYAEHEQKFGRMRGWLYRNIIRHWMNARVRAFRAGRLKPDASIAHEHQGETHAT